MEITIKIDTEKHTEEDYHKLVSSIFSTTTPTASNPGQQKIINENNEDKEEHISIVVRNGAKTTKSVKEELKKLGFNFKTQNKKGESDPRWTLTCIKNYWNNIKDNEALNGLTIWTSQEEGNSEG